MNRSSTCDCIALDALGVDVGELDDHVARQSEARELGNRAEEVEIETVVGRTPELGRVAQESGITESISEHRVHSGADDDLIERVVGATPTEDAVDDPRPVGVEQRLDRGEREATVLQVADLLESLAVGRTVDLRPADTLGGREKTFTLVEADRVDGQAALAGEVVDAQITGRLVGHRVPPVGRSESL